MKGDELFKKLKEMFEESVHKKILHKKRGV
jgi:hypothetical protein